jgi:hypothetical protein
MWFKLKVAAGVLAAIGILFTVAQVCWVAGETVEVMQEEFGPRAMLQKYEWFKDAAATLEAKQANIAVVVASIEQLGNVPRHQWDRADKQEWSLLTAEARGLVASFNGLASAYNAEMAKFNWQFANRGELPKGAEKPLPREFKPYQYEF